jgi:hypothetical protein
MNRRDLLAGVGGLIGGLAIDAQTSNNGPRISILEYGADPTGIQDSTRAIQNAIASVRVKLAQALVFPRGSYRLDSVQRIAMDFTGMSNFEIDGGGSTLLMGRDARCISITRCSNAVIRDFTIDWDPLPFTQGTVTASGSYGFLLQVDPGFPVPAIADLLAIGSYDRSTKVLARKPFLDLYPRSAKAQAAGASELRVEMTLSSPMPVGTVLVLRFKGGHDVIGITDSHDVAVRSVKVCSSYSAGFTVTRCRDLTFDGLTIGMPAGSNRLLSTNADGIDFHNCTGALLLQKCVLFGMGDDGINTITEMWRLRSGAGSTASIFKRSGGPVAASELSSPEGSLDILDAHDLHAIGHAKAVPSKDNRSQVQIDVRTMSSNVDGAVVVDSTLAPKVQIFDCEFRGNRARGLIVHSNVEIRDCIFQNTTLSAILLAPDSVYMEGPPTRNVTIQSSHFSGCHYGSKDPEGSITVDVMHSYSRRTAIPDGQAENVKIIDNFFESCATAAIACRSVDQLVIQENRFGPTWTEGDGSSLPRAMILSQLTNSTIANNVSIVPNAIFLDRSERTTVMANDRFTVASH